MDMAKKGGIALILTFILKLILRIECPDVAGRCSVLLNSRNDNGSGNVLAESRTTYRGEMVLFSTELRI